MMTNKRKIEEPPQIPKETPRLNAFCSSVLISVIHGISVIFLTISGCIIGLEYHSIILGNVPTEIQKIKLDYSITIFAGSAIFLLIYTYEVKKIVNKIFNVKEIKPKK